MPDMENINATAPEAPPNGKSKLPTPDENMPVSVKKVTEPELINVGRARNQRLIENDSAPRLATSSEIVIGEKGSRNVSKSRIETATPKKGNDGATFNNGTKSSLVDEKRPLFSKNVVSVVNETQMNNVGHARHKIRTKEDSTLSKTQQSLLVTPNRTIDGEKRFKTSMKAAPEKNASSVVRTANASLFEQSPKSNAGDVAQNVSPDAPRLYDLRSRKSEEMKPLHNTRSSAKKRTSNDTDAAVPQKKQTNDDSLLNASADCLLNSTFLITTTNSSTGRDEAIIEQPPKTNANLLSKLFSCNVKLIRLKNIKTKSAESNNSIAPNQTVECAKFIPDDGTSTISVDSAYESNASDIFEVNKIPSTQPLYETSKNRHSNEHVLRQLQLHSNHVDDREHTPAKRQQRQSVIPTPGSMNISSSSEPFAIKIETPERRDGTKKVTQNVMRRSLLNANMISDAEHFRTTKLDVAMKRNQDLFYIPGDKEDSNQEMCGLYKRDFLRCKRATSTIAIKL